MERMSMDARLARFALIGASLLLLGANYRTQHFIVTATTPQLAQEVGLAAEQLRRDLAIEWLGHELPPWTDICPITVHVAPGKPAGGETSFVFPVGGGEPTKWRMIVEGTRERVLDSVLPHEITHTIFATHFRQPLPRWADEGACTTVEHDVEKQKQERLLIQFLTSNRGIAFNQMFAMREYPRDILPLYSQGYALARYLIAQGGKRKFVDYVGEGLKTNNWTHATRKHYGFESLSDLQVTWLDWVREGSPPIAQHAPSAERMAAHQGKGRPATQGGATSLVSTTAPAPTDSRRADQADPHSLPNREGNSANVPPDPLASPSAPLPPPSRNPVALVSHQGDSILRITMARITMVQIVAARMTGAGTLANAIKPTPPASRRAPSRGRTRRIDRRSPWWLPITLSRPLAPAKWKGPSRSCSSGAADMRCRTPQPIPPVSPTSLKPIVPQQMPRRRHPPLPGRLLPSRIGPLIRPAPAATSGPVTLGTRPDRLESGECPDPWNDSPATGREDHLRADFTIVR
jgi:hypothetical protein